MACNRLEGNSSEFLQPEISYIANWYRITISTHHDGINYCPVLYLNQDIGNRDMI